jgi:hypothetical protein
VGLVHSIVTKVVWNFLRLISAVYAMVLISDRAIAAKVPATPNATQISSDSSITKGLRNNQPLKPTISEPTITHLKTLSQPRHPQRIAQTIESANEGRNNSQVQITSVSQLSDIQPTDWEFQALQSIVKRYGCITNYPDGAFQRSRNLTRSEFVVGLSACLDRVSKQLAQGLIDRATNEDLAKMQRLREEFATELEMLRGRVDTLEAGTAQLESNQFSPTTKLNGEIIFVVAGVLDEDETLDTDNDGVVDTGTDSQVTFSSQVQLEFNTSFTGKDELSVKLQSSNVNNFVSDPMGFSFSGDTNNNFELDQLFYTFPVGDRVQVFIGASGTGIDDFVTSTISPFDNSDGAGSGSLSDFGLPQQYSFDPGDIGVGANIWLTDNLTLDVGYSAGKGNDPSGGVGLVNGDYAAIGQLTFLGDSFDAAITYVNSYSADGFITDSPEGVNIFGAQVNFKLLDNVEMGGGLAYINATQRGMQNFNAWSYQLTLAFPDLGREGNLLGILAGVPLNSRDLLTPDSTGFLVEIFYQHKLTDNIVITPGIIYNGNPFNNSDNRDSIIGAVRTTFSF